MAMKNGKGTIGQGGLTKIVPTISSTTLWCEHTTRSLARAFSTK